MSDELNAKIRSASTAPLRDLYELLLALQRASQEPGIDPEWSAATEWPLLKRSLRILATYQQITPERDYNAIRINLITAIAEMLTFGLWFIFDASKGKVNESWIETLETTLSKNEDPEKEHLLIHYTGQELKNVIEFLKSSANEATTLKAYPDDFIISKFSQWRSCNPSVSRLSDLIAAGVEPSIIRTTMRLERRTYINLMRSRSYMVRIGIQSILRGEGAQALEAKLMPFLTS